MAGGSVRALSYQYDKLNLGFRHGFVNIIQGDYPKIVPSRTCSNTNTVLRRKMFSSSNNPPPLPRNMYRCSNLANPLTETLPQCYLVSNPDNQRNIQTATFPTTHTLDAPCPNPKSCPCEEDRLHDEAQKNLFLQILREERVWDIHLDKHHSRNMKGVPVKVMSYNTLSQSLLHLHQHLYNKCKLPVLCWSHRRRELLREFIESDADVLCLQEMEAGPYREFFEPAMAQHGYKGLYKQRTGDKQDGCAIFYRTSRFELIKWFGLNFRQDNVRTLGADNIAIVALLSPIIPDSRVTDPSAPPELLCITNTHIVFDPRLGDTKLAQLQMLFAELDRVTHTGKWKHGRPVYHPTILCGDMNTLPASKLYKFVTEGSIRFEGCYSDELSGQSTKNNMKSWSSIPNFVLPQHLGITDQCQFATEHYRRIQNNRTNYYSWDDSDQDSFDEDDEEEHTAKLMYSLYADLGVSTEKNNVLSFGSGTLSHRLGLTSAYRHHQRQTTSDSNGTIYIKGNGNTVDYIFYSSENKKKQKGSAQHKLQLMATLRLIPSHKLEVFDFLPNIAQPSDHLPLMANFIYRTDGS